MDAAHQRKIIALRLQFRRPKARRISDSYGFTHLWAHYICPTNDIISVKNGLIIVIGVKLKQFTFHLRTLKDVFLSV